jgi:hypothetical protein
METRAKEISDKSIIKATTIDKLQTNAKQKQSSPLIKPPRDAFE